MHSANFSHSYSWVPIALYGDSAEKAVSLLELVARGYLTISLSTLYHLSRQKSVLLGNTWDADSHISRTQRNYERMILMAACISLIVLIFMFLPLSHNGFFSACIFTIYGMVDNLPWTICLSATSATVIRRAGPFIVSFFISLCRLFMVILPGQQPLLEVQ